LAGPHQACSAANKNFHEGRIFMSAKPINLSGLVAPAPGAKKSVSRGPDAAEKEINFENLGGVKVGQHVPENTEKEISFEHLGGVCVRRASNHPANAAPDAPAESVEPPTEEEEDEFGE
jgi:hypothetical protein